LEKRGFQRNFKKMDKNICEKRTMTDKEKVLKMISTKGGML